MKQRASLFVAGGNFVESIYELEKLVVSGAAERRSSAEQVETSWQTMRSRTACSVVAGAGRCTANKITTKSESAKKHVCCMEAP